MADNAHVAVVPIDPPQTAAAVEERSKLQKHFGRFDMLFFLVCTLVGLDTLGAVARAGPVGVTWMTFLGVFFFVPYALLIAELGSTFPDEGGCYVWTKLAFGRFAGGVCTVLYWLSNPIWLGGLLSITAVATWNSFFGHLNHAGEYVFSTIFIWIGVWAAILSFRIGKWIPTLGAWARIVLLSFFTLSVFLYALQHGLHVPRLGQFGPTYASFIALVPVLFFNFVGFELPSAAGEEMKHPQHDVPFAVMRSAVLAILLYAVPIVSILMVVPSERITGLSGFIDSMKLVFTVYGGTITAHGAELSGAGWVLGRIAAGLFLLVLLSSGTSWIMGADRSQAVAGYDGAGPRILGVFSKRYGTPVVVNLLTGILATASMVLAFAVAGGSLEKYFNAVLTIALLFTTLSYAFIFPALIRLRYTHPDVPRPYRVPFGNSGAWVCVILTTFWALFASLVGFFPGLFDGALLNDHDLPLGFTRGEFQLVVFVPFVLAIATGVAFYAMGRKTREAVVGARP